MNFTTLDFIILISMTTAMISMGVVLPELGLVQTGVDNETLPQFSLSESQVDIVGDRPAFPSTPDGGELRYDYNLEGSIDSPEEDREYLRRDASESPAQLRLEFTPENGVGVDQGPMNLSIRAFDSNHNFIDVTHSTFDSDNTTTVEAHGYEVFGEVVEYRNNDSSEFYSRAEWSIVSTPSDSNWYSGIPVLGGLFSAGSYVAGILSWLITIFFWFAAWLIELALSLISILLHIVLFVIEWVNVLLSVWAGIVGATSGISQILLTIVPMVLFVELLKVGFIMLSLLPTT